MGLNQIFLIQTLRTVFFCLFLIAQNANAQTCSISYTNPNPDPAFGSPLTVSGTNGFTSSNPNSVTDFPKNKTTILTSPAYHYNGDQPTIYFAYNLTKAEAGNTNATPTITVLYGTNLSISCTASGAFDFNDGTSTVYFSITPGGLFPADTDFRIQLSIELTGGDKVLVANSLTTNAILSGLQSPIALPVTFAGFYAKNSNGYTSLTWNIAGESNVAGYEVQRSIDGSNFFFFFFVAATNSPSYSFVDNKSGDIVYYRIKSIDNDGKYSYSIIVNIKGLQSDVIMKAFPMPVQNQLTVQHSTANNNSKLEIVSVDGRMIKALSLTEGTQQTNIDLSSEKSGVYLVRYVNGLHIQTAKIIKQ